MHSSPSKALEPSLSQTAGIKRSASALLPPFEPLSSSPTLPPPSKRQATSNSFTNYPTPVPSSSSGIVLSSPPCLVGSRPVLGRTVSISSERAPLSAVPSVELDENGEPLLMGRSSNSSQYQLSANRLISRIHVKARYIPATEPFEPNQVEIMCTGWNGLTIRCQGRTWELAKGDTFTSETEGAEIMIDVQEARVIVNWPRHAEDQGDDMFERRSESPWNHSPRLVTAAESHGAAMNESPQRRARRISSPESPTPAPRSRANLRALMPDISDEKANVEIYEDPSSDEPELPGDDKANVEIYEDASSNSDEHEYEQHGDGNANVEIYEDSSSDERELQLADGVSIELSYPSSDEESDHDEENEPVVPSLGPFGANLNNRLAAFTTALPRVTRASQASQASQASLEETSLMRSSLLKPSNPSSVQASLKVPVTESATIPLSVAQSATIANHVANQLAFSRLSSTPLSAIMNNLPAEDKQDLSRDALERVLESTSCIGTIPRQGKDAAGKALESEYYYIAEHDADGQRRLAVTDGMRKPSLRNCRKQHKQYYWKRPRTP